MSFGKHFTLTKMNESILDAPQDQLDPFVWITDGDNVSLTPEATTKIQKVVDYIQGKWNFPDLSVFIIGSITSNSYSPDSDIDIDFVSPTDMSKEEVMSFGWEMKSDFIKNYIEKNQLFTSVPKSSIPASQVSRTK